MTEYRISLNLEAIERLQNELDIPSVKLHVAPLTSHYEGNVCFGMSWIDEKGYHVAMQEDINVFDNLNHWIETFLHEFRHCYQIYHWGVRPVHWCAKLAKKSKRFYNSLSPIERDAREWASENLKRYQDLLVVDKVEVS